MKERPILFSSAMVRAILEGRKTMTRRVIKDVDRARHLNAAGNSGCPYGQPGDRLWVRETFFALGRWETRFNAKKRRDEWHFVDMTDPSENGYLYVADGISNTGAFIKRRSDFEPMYWKRPAIFMPRWASRIDLEITGVRVERLQDISVDDCLAEGIDRSQIGEMTYITMPSHMRERFKKLWESINGPGSWDANPWVWVVEFKRVQPCCIENVE